MVEGEGTYLGLDALAALWTAQDGASLMRRSGRLALDLSELLGEIETEMAQCCALTQADNGVGLRLTLQRRATGAVSLRWKTERQRSLSAQELVRRVADLPVEAGRWYATLTVKVRWLNARERLVRHARQVVRDLSSERDFNALIRRYTP